MRVALLLMLHAPPLDQRQLLAVRILWLLPREKPFYFIICMMTPAHKVI